MVDSSTIFIETHFVLLHTHLGSVVAGDLAEALVAVDDWKVDDLSVRQQEAAVG